MLLNLLNLIKDALFLMGSYSLNVFPDPLTKEEEEILIDKMFKNEIDARNKLIEHNLRLVAHIVKKYETNGVDPDDLISIGTIGLIKGINTYKRNKNVKITTYAAKCIENEILMYFRSNKKYINNVSLDDKVGYDKDGNEISLIDIIKSERKDIADDIQDKINIELLNKYLKVLNKREKEIIVYRYGLYNYDEQTQKEIANKLGISRSYVSRIEKRAITKILREFLKETKNM